MREPPFVASIPREVANQIYDLLVEHAGASPHTYEREMFLYHQERGCTEYRFGGKLGLGGKFWSGWYVTCYPEDEDHERKEILKRTNEALTRLRRALARCA